MSIHLHGLREGQSLEKVAYIRQMLGELRQVASGEGTDMLCYLIEMAYLEAGDVQSGLRPRSFVERDGNQTAGVTI
jgi:hypothetical protein